MTAGLNLELLTCRLSFFAGGELQFPAPASNLFRGALGYELPEAIFRPQLHGGPSGLADPPRPFVLQTKELDRRSIKNSSFGFDLILFAPDLESTFREAFVRLAATGIGPSRTPLRLLNWDSRHVGIRLDEVEPALVVRVHFETPTELKGWDGAGLPPFGVLMRRLRDRISALRSLYGRGALDMDFAGFGERAGQVMSVGGELKRSRAHRTSSRTGQTHPLGGITGWVQYQGDLGEFMPFLRAGAYTGVGRQTVWGHGHFILEILS